MPLNTKIALVISLIKAGYEVYVAVQKIADEHDIDFQTLYDALPDKFKKN